MRVAVRFAVVFVVGLVGCLAHGGAATGAQPAATEPAPRSPATTTDPCEHFSVELEAAPLLASCTDTIDLTLRFELPDTCWEITQGPQLFPGLFRFDYWTQIVRQQTGCLTVVTPVSFDQTVGPLEPGPHRLGTQLTAWSDQLGTVHCFLDTPFEVRCCDDLPPEVSDLRLDKLGDTVRLTWADEPEATDYLVFGEAGPDGSFSSPFDTEASGLVGVDVAMGNWRRYFLVAGRNACGAGPTH